MWTHYYITCFSVTEYIKYLLSPDYLSLQQLRYYFPNCFYPNPPWQLFLWEETGAHGENPRLSAERWLTLFKWVHSENGEPTMSEVKGAYCDDCTNLQSWPKQAWLQAWPKGGGGGDMRWKSPSFYNFWPWKLERKVNALIANAPWCPQLYYFTLS
jgi:hypothetical protein